MNPDQKRFDKALSDDKDEVARAIMIPWLSKYFDNVRENDADDWSVPDAECDDYYHELQVSSNKYNCIRIWGRKEKYLNLYKPTVFWCIMDSKTVAFIEGKYVKLFNKKKIYTGKSESGYEYVWDIPKENFNMEVI